MDPRAERELGRTGVRLTQLGLGGAGFGNVGGEISDAGAVAAIAEAWNAGIRYFDTAPWYGRGLSEHRVGDGLRPRPPSSYVLSTKVGRLLRPVREAAAAERFEVRFDYGYAGVIRSFEDSVQRLLLPSVDLAVVHDLDLGYHSPQARMDAHLGRLATEGWDALSDLKRAGAIRAVGVGINHLGLIPRFLELFDVDFFLLAQRYTLMEQASLDTELARCAERGVGVVIGAVFNSGLLATGPVPGARYEYRDATPGEMARAGRIQAVCERHGVPLAAAALQFPLGHPSVASVIPGALSPDHVRRNVEHFRHPIPPDLWAELRAEGLLREDAPVPAPG